SSATDGVTNNGQVNVGLEAGASWQYSLDGTTWTAGSGTSIAASVFGADGAETAQVRQTDAAGNTSSVASVCVTLGTIVSIATLSLTIDTGSSATDRITSNGQVDVGFVESTATWEYSLNGGATWTAGSGMSIAASVFGADGAKTVQARKTDLAGNLSSDGRRPV